MRQLGDDLTEARRRISRVHPRVLGYIAELEDDALERADRDLCRALISQAPSQASSLWNLYAAVNEEIGFRALDTTKEQT